MDWYNVTVCRIVHTYKIEQYMEDQNKAERPSLLDDQLNVLNEKVNWKKIL